VGTLLLYYWCTFFMRLVFGSFTVAVLVGAFNRANADLLKSKKDQKRLPIGYTSIASRRTGLRRALDFVWHLLTFRHNGHFVPRLEGALNHLVTGGKVNKRVGKNGQEFIELTQQHITEVLGAHACELLVRDYGVVPAEPRSLDVSVNAQEVLVSVQEQADETRKKSKTKGDPAEDVYPLWAEEMLAKQQAANIMLSSHLSFLNDRVSKIDEHLSSVRATQEHIYKAVSTLTEANKPKMVKQRSSRATGEKSAGAGNNSHGSRSVSPKIRSRARSKSPYDPNAATDEYASYANETFGVSSVYADVSSVTPKVIPLENVSVSASSDNSKTRRTLQPATKGQPAKGQPASWA